MSRSTPAERAEEEYISRRSGRKVTKRKEVEGGQMATQRDAEAAHTGNEETKEEAHDEAHDEVKYSTALAHVGLPVAVEGGHGVARGRPMARRHRLT